MLPSTKAYPPTTRLQFVSSRVIRESSRVSCVSSISVIDCSAQWGQDSRRVKPRKGESKPVSGFNAGLIDCGPETNDHYLTSWGGLSGCHREQGTLERQWLRTVRIDQPAFASSPSGKYLKSFEKNRRIWRTRVVSLPSTLAFIDSWLFVLGAGQSRTRRRRVFQGRRTHPNRSCKRQHVEHKATRDHIFWPRACLRRVV